MCPFNFCQQLLHDRAAVTAETLCNIQLQLSQVSQNTSFPLQLQMSIRPMAFSLDSSLNDLKFCCNVFYPTQAYQVPDF